MTSVRTEAQKRAASEVVEVASNGLHEVYMIDTTDDECTFHIQGFQTPANTEIAVKSNDEDMISNDEDMIKRPRLSSVDIPQGVNGAHSDDIIEVQSSPKNDDEKANARRSARRSRPSGSSRGLVETKKKGEDKDAAGKSLSRENMGASAKKTVISFSKRSKLSRHPHQGLNAADALKNAAATEKVNLKSERSVPQNGSPATSFSLLPYVKLMPLPSSVTVSLNEGQSVNITEFLSDLEKKKENIKTIELVDVDIKVEPEVDVDASFVSSKKPKTSAQSSNYTRKNKRNHGMPSKSINGHVEHKVPKQSNNVVKKKNSSHRLSSTNNSVHSHHEAPDQVGNDIKKSSSSNGRASSSTDVHVKCEIEEEFSRNIGTERRRSCGKPSRFNDYVFGFDRLVTKGNKKETGQKTKSSREKGVLRKIKRPKKVTGKRKLKKTIKRVNLKQIVDSFNEETQQSKRVNGTPHSEKVKSIADEDMEEHPQFPINKEAELGTIRIPKEETLQESNRTEPEQSITTKLESSQKHNEEKIKSENIPKKKRRATKKRERSHEPFEEDNTCYVVVNHGTQRGSRRLVGADGFSYNVTKSSTTGRVYWRCSHRPTAATSCRVVVKKEGDIYMRKYTHTHDAEPEAFVKSLISAELKKKCLKDFVHSPKKIVEDILRENEALISRSGSKINISYLIRRFNRSRQNLKKLNPLITAIKLTSIFPLPFLIEDVVFDQKRHLLFATKKQLRILARSDRWYIDITSKFVKKPFSYLLSVSAYIQDDTQGDEKVKLKPLAFAIMSSLQVADVVKVMRALVKHLRKPLLVRSFVLDFFEPLWMGIRRLFFNCKLYGCAWKFGQCIWAKIQRLGIKDDQVGLYDEIHKLLKLPFVHPKNIKSTFEMLKVEFLSEPSFEEFVKYMEFTWFCNHVWKIANWCVHSNPFRTKVEVIGWHYAINITPNCNLLDTLVDELHIIAQSLPDSTRPAHQKRVREHYLENDTTPQGKIYKLWARESSMGVHDFLSLCCDLSEPTMEGMVEKMIEEFRSREEHP